MSVHLSSELHALRRRTWFNEGMILGLVRGADCVIVLATALLASLTRFQDAIFPPAIESYAMVIGVLLVPYVFSAAGLYSIDMFRGFSCQIQRVVGAWALIILILVVMGFLTKTSHDASRIWAALWFAYGIVALLGIRLFFKYRIHCWQDAGFFTENVVIVGDLKLSLRLLHLIENDVLASSHIIGFFDTEEATPSWNEGRVPTLGGLEELIVFARSHHVDKIVVALATEEAEQLRALSKRLRHLPIDVYCWSGIEAPCSSYRMEQFHGLPALKISERPLAGWGLVIKSAADILLALVILVLICPLCVLIGIAIRLDSSGPLLFRQKRFGFNNEVIDVIKFRTMYTNADECLDVRQASRDDSRVTRVGRWLRRTSLDELPQLINVLKGEMSLVGPRPHALAHNELYAKIIDDYSGRHKVKPGITGWAQVNGLRGETDVIEKMELRVKYDLYYIENWSIGFDILILVRTLVSGFMHHNAY